MESKQARTIKAALLAVIKQGDLKVKKSADFGKEREVILNVSHSFDSSHFLPDYDGECANLHGHTWHVSIKVKGIINNTTGMLVDFKSIKAVLKEFDHTFLNALIDIPTAENLAYLIGFELEKFLPRKCALQSITLFETANNSVEVLWKKR